MIKAAPSRGDRLFVSVDGEHDSASFIARAQAERTAHGRSFDLARWFCEDEELIRHGGRTYAVSNQWGMGTELTLRELTTSFPDAHVAVEFSAG